MLRDASDERERWLVFFREQGEALSVTAEILSQTKGVTEQILTEALLVLGGTKFCVEFAQSAAIRAVVKAALVNNCDAHHSPAEQQLVSCQEDTYVESWTIE